MAFGFLKKAARSAGRGLKKAGKGIGKVAKGAVKEAGKGIKTVGKAGRTVGRGLGKVPVVGGGLKGVFDLTVNRPFQIADKVARGQRLDKVALNTLKEQVQAARAVAPYAQTVISLVPAVGPGVSAGLGAGLALASGKPISAALIEGAKTALPGGALAKSAFDVGKAVAEGKRVDKAVLAGLPIDANAKRALEMGLDVTARVVRGENVGDALIKQADTALKIVPASALNGLNVGIALGEAKRLQSIAINTVRPEALNSLKRGGTNIIKQSPVLASASKVLTSQASRAGYSVGVAVMQHTKPQPFHIAAIRARMNPQQKTGFDMALAARIGMAKKPAPRGLTPAQQLGYYTTRGVIGSSKAPAIIKAVESNPEVKSGLKVAVIEKPGLWGRIKKWVSDITK